MGDLSYYCGAKYINNFSPSYTMTTIAPLQELLHKEQAYVHEVADMYQIPMQFKEHAVATKSCAQKADLLGWDPTRVIKALYVSNGEYNLGIITPETGARVPLKELIAEELGISKKKAARFTMGDYLPQGMTYGTCTPFSYDSCGQNDISLFLIKDAPELHGQMVNISIGGTDDISYRQSMHIPYDGIFKILEHQFGDKVRKVNF